MSQSAAVNVNVDVVVDVAVLGGGIAGHAMAFLLQEREGCNVCLIDPQAGTKSGTWYPNYGEWREEWHELARRLAMPELETCTTHEWEKTDCFLGGSHDIPTDQRTRLNRAYVRLDGKKLQGLLRSRYDKAGGRVIASRLTSKLIATNLFDQNLVHDATGSTLTLDDGSTVRARLVVDATGSESRLVQREDPLLARGNPMELTTGYQIAYGFEAEVTSPGPYDMDAMTLFDYRTTHFAEGCPAMVDGCERPTFMYTMPFQKLGPNRYRIFFEETSLVGRGERRLQFEECKRRAMARLAHHDIEVLSVQKEEFCYVPMGGELPDLKQRVVAFGGAANMVHPATGYQVCRMLAAATDVSTAIGTGLRGVDGWEEGASTSALTQAMAAVSAPDAVAARAYGAMWSQRTRGQRDFQAFGGAFLMLQSVANLRGFFAAFFAVPVDMWGGFLAGWPGLPGNAYHETWNARLSFAVQLFAKMPNAVRLAMVLYSTQYTATFGPGTLVRSLTPAALSGEGPAPQEWVPPPPDDQVGDPEAKVEARHLMATEEGTRVRPTAPTL